MQYQSTSASIANEELMFQHLFSYTLILKISSYDFLALLTCPFHASNICPTGFIYNF
jgi:hypothetical protein